MSLRQMEFVLAVADSLSFTKAAKRLGVSQPSLSQSVLNLESELKVRLFERQSPLKLTLEGELYVQKARLIMEAYYDLNSELSSLVALKSDSVRIGFSQNGYKMIPGALAKFCRRFSRANIKITQPHSTLQIRQMLLDGEIDLGMLILPLDTAELEYESIKRSKLYACAGANSALGRRYRSFSRVSLVDLKDEKFILPARSQRNRAILDAAFARAGYEPNVLCEVQTFDVATAMAASGVGVCFTLAEAASSGDEMVLLDVGETGLDKELVIAYKKGKKLSRLESEFIKIAKQE
ncbi:LysR family transcriptional regulator [Campylobacter sp. 19-13652]|uniref:LysR family transcriptional regulator n=1 Tax=Campylobacter sp. 19-13652 TaxID=2840180 RepID=UPI001C76745F|nr:LysR family transcriptional regulator [Campylobacter sp. 19-13652]BCX78731.1 LysR family transcriptional regulator [Campylobacter sp. 19-13652]